MIPNRYLLAFHSKYKKLDNGCWEWIAGRFENGYGKHNKYSVKYGLDHYAHRTSWIIHHGPIPPDLEVCHRCDNPSCVNPEHLFLGTHLENMLDAVNKGRLYGWKRPSGESHGRAKLSLSQVELIRADTRARRIIAKEYGVSISRVSKIKLNQSWRTPNGVGGKLTSDQGREIITSTLTQQALSVKFNVCRSTISKIINRSKHEDI